MILSALTVAALVSAAPPATAAGPAPSQFACGEAHKLLARFDGDAKGAFALVDAGDGPHRLALQPWGGGEPEIRWSDGHRSLTWSPGVKLMWMDGPTHLMCGRAEGHKH